MPGHSVNQDNNSAGGHIAGRDVVDVTMLPPPVQETVLGRLFNRMKVEAKDDQTLCDYISELEVFTRTVANEQVVGLDSKLTAAGRADQIDMALAMKEMVFSQLRQNVFSPTFQQIYATLLGKVFEEFETWVKPAILAGAARQDVDALVNGKVIRPIMSEVEQCGDYHGVATQTIRGMVYFLTGNCHIRWN
jgi:hypothetical protein